MIPELKEGQFKSTCFILDNKTILKKGEAFDELICTTNEKGENLHIRKVGDGVTNYKNLPIELSYYDKFEPDLERGIDL